MNISCKSKRSGFTLIEILVILFIVAILAAILFTVFSRVRENGRTTACKSNLKQITLAIQQYVADNDGYYPSSSSPARITMRGGRSQGYFNAIAPYVKNTDIFFCPSAPNPNLSGSLVDYVINRPQLTDFPIVNNVAKASHDTKPLDPSATLLLSEGAWFDANGAINLADVQSSCGPMGVATTHFNGSNTAFLDGHVKWFSNEQLVEQVLCPMLAWQRQNQNNK